MNTKPHDPNLVADKDNLAMDDFELQDAIELLAMHELAPAQRTQLLHAIADKPHLWRVLAIEFVENQILQEAMQAEKVSLVNPAPSNLGSNFIPLDREERRQSSWLRPLYVAACFMLCFVGGVLWGGSPNGPRLAMLSQEKTVGVPADLVGADDEGDKGSISRSEPGPGLSEKQIGNSQVTVVNNVVQSEATGLGRVAWVDRFGMRVLPVFSQSESAKAWTEMNPPRLDGGLKRMLARSGWDVKADWNFMAGKLASGEDFVIPVAQPQYEYVGLRVH